MNPVKAAALAKNPRMLLVEEDAKRYPLSTEVTPWGISAIGALDPALAASGNAMVCIIDSGYAIHHDDLPQSVRTFPDA